MSSRTRGCAAVIFSAVASPTMPPPMIVRSYCDAIGSWASNVEQATRILFHESLHAFRIRLRTRGREAFAKRAEAAAIVGTKDNILLSHLVDQKRQRAGVRAGAIDREMF